MKKIAWCMAAFVALFALVDIREAWATGGEITVGSCSELQAVDDSAANASASIRLTSDIDCNGVAYASLFRTVDFSGQFDGAGFTISNITIAESAQSEVGLFSVVNGATLKNVRLTSVSVQGSAIVGGIAGRMINTNLYNIEVNGLVAGSVAAGGYIGGVAGDYSHSSGLITAKHLAATVTIQARHSAGGIFGATGGVGDLTASNLSATAVISMLGTAPLTATNFGGIIGVANGDDGADVLLELCSAQATITGGYLASGGIAGTFGPYSSSPVTGAPINMTVRDCRVNATISGTVGSGGLIGAAFGELQSYYDDNDPGMHLTIQRIAASGSLTADDLVGGLAGDIFTTHSDVTSLVTIEDAYVSASIASPGSFLGGLTGSGYNAGDVSVSDYYFDETLAGISNCADLAVVGCTAIDTGTTPAYFLGNSSSAPFPAWDFSAVWRTNTGAHPSLRIDTSDGDGVSEFLEYAGPNNGDANNDTIVDAAQPAVAATKNAVNGKFTVLEATANCSASGAVSTLPEPTSHSDTAYQYPLGLIDFSASGCPVGGAATFSHYYYEEGLNANDYILRKFNSVTNTYATLAPLSKTIVTIGGQQALKVTYAIVDGSSSDEDGAANGTIVDPAGPAILAATSISGGAIGAPNTGAERMPSDVPIWIATATLIVGVGLYGVARARQHATR